MTPERERGARGSPFLLLPSGGCFEYLGFELFEDRFVRTIDLDDLWGFAAFLRALRASDLRLHCVGKCGEFLNCEVDGWHCSSSLRARDCALDMYLQTREK